VPTAAAQIAEESHLLAEERTEFGKGAARRVRRDHKVPAVLYGHGQAPRHLSLPGHGLMLALKHGGANALLTLKLSDGEALALPKAVTRDPIRGSLEHVDLIIVRRGERVSVEIAITLVGDPTAGVLITQPINTITLEAEATAIPNGLEINIEDLAPGDNVLASAIELPAGATLTTDPDAVVVAAVAEMTAEQLDAELSSAEAELGIVAQTSADGSASGEGDIVGDTESGAGGPSTN